MGDFNFGNDVIYTNKSDCKCVCIRLYMYCCHFAPIETFVVSLREYFRVTFYIKRTHFQWFHLSGAVWLLAEMNGYSHGQRVHVHV